MYITALFGFVLANALLEQNKKNVRKHKYIVVLSSRSRLGRAGGDNQGSEDEKLQRTTCTKSGSRNPMVTTFLVWSASYLPKSTFRYHQHKKKHVLHHNKWG
jgi:hypothetical protein